MLITQTLKRGGAVPPPPSVEDSGRYTGYRILDEGLTTSHTAFSTQPGFLQKIYLLKFVRRKKQSSDDGENHNEHNGVTADTAL